MLLRKASAPSAASCDDIDIWLTYYNEIDDDRQLARMRSLLSDEEVAREGRFYFAEDRKRYLVTRAMVRLVLSRYARIAPERWAFSKNVYGRPAIADDIVRTGREAPRNPGDMPRSDLARYTVKPRAPPGPGGARRARLR